MPLTNHMLTHRMTKPRENYSSAKRKPSVILSLLNEFTGTFIFVVEVLVQKSGS